MQWLDTVDTSYRRAFKDLFEANFGRAAARIQALQTRISGFEARLEA